MREIQIPAGERVRVVRRRFSSFPDAIRIDARSVDAEEEPSGVIEVRGSNWIFPKPPAIFPLQSTNVVRKGYWDTFYSVFITPEADVVVTLRTSRLAMLKGPILAALALGSLAALVMVLATC